MAFWGVEVKPGRPFTLTASNSQARLHVSQATLGVGNAKNKSIVQCNVGDKSPVFLCALSPDKVESSQLNLEFEEAVEVIFSVVGPRSIHLTGYYLNRKTSFMGNDDESETYGEDIVDTDTERSNAENDYDYSDSFINDDDPSTHRDSSVSDSDDELTIKERADKINNKKRNGKSRRLRKKFQVSDSDVDENWKFGAFSVVDDSSTGSSVELHDSESEQEVQNSPSKNALSSRRTRSKAKGSENGKTDSKKKNTLGVEAHHIHGVPDQRGDKSSDDLLQSSNQEGQKSSSKKKRRKETQNSSVEGDNSQQNLSEGFQNEKPAIDKAEPLKKKRKKEGQERSIDKQNLSKCTENDKNVDVEADRSADHPQTNKKTSKKCRKVLDEDNIDKSESGKKARDNEYSHITNNPPELETSSTGLIIEELEKGNLDGKSAVKGKKVSIIYTGKLKENGQVFDSNFGKDPLRFRLGGDKVIKGLNIGVEGMRAGDKRRLIIPPSLGYTKDGPIEDLPKNAWLVYEVEAVKVR